MLTRKFMKHYGDSQLHSVIQTLERPALHLSINCRYL